LPISLLVALLGTALITVFMQAGQYGITIDEPIQDQYGRSTLAWYESMGKDISFLTSYPASDFQPQHGAAFETLVAAAQQVFGHQWYTRAVVNGLAGVVGVVAIALCGLELGGWWMALLAALSLWLYPRFFGAIFNNSKDIPFASAYVLVLWSVLLLVRHWGDRRRSLLMSILVGVLVGIAVSVRVNAVVWYAMLGLLLLGWWVRYGLSAWREHTVMTHLVQQLLVALIIGGTSLATMIVCWPYVTLNPLHNLYDAIVVMVKYPWNDQPVLFAGQMYRTLTLPRRYAPTWLVIGSPPAVVIYACAGGIVVCIELIRHKMIKAPIAVICLALLFPLGLIVGLHATVFDTMRHFLFVIPPLLLLAVYGFMRVLTFLAYHKQKLIVTGLVVLSLVAQIQVIKDMQDLHPYEYMYFSPLIGGVAGANGKYEMDYWGICNKPAGEWLAQNYTKYTGKQSPTVKAPYITQLMPYLPGTFHESAPGVKPDFYVSITRWGLDKQFPSYKTIHTEGVEGYVACVVKVNPVSVSSASDVHTNAPGSS
jgi:hypothetical protein